MTGATDARRGATGISAAIALPYASADMATMIAKNIRFMFHSRNGVEGNDSPFFINPCCGKGTVQPKV
jgi:hypothetical protein